MFSFWRKLRRKEILESEFPEDYKKLISKNVPLYRCLEQVEQRKLESLVRILLSEKRFVGAGGLDLTEEMCVAIAARACLLVLRRTELDDPLYPDLGSIVVYPHSYKARVERRDGYVVTEGEEQRLGESWQHGTLVLSWQAVRQGAAIPDDGHDVVLHEFAHQLDGQDGVMNGTPELASSAGYSDWARVFTEEFEALRAKVDANQRTDIDAYAATNPAEFFAVVSEEFFENPSRLKRNHPELYRELAGYYRLDPLQLLEVAEVGGA
jgi:MtfA peptidase